MITGGLLHFQLSLKIEKFLRGFLDQYENLETLQTYSDKKIFLGKLTLNDNIIINFSVITKNYGKK